MRQKKLFTPGPVEVPWQVLQKLSEPLIHHRTEDFRVIHRATMSNLQQIMKTKNPVVVHAATAGMVGKNDEDQLPSLDRHGQHVVESRDRVGNPVDGQGCGRQKNRRHPERACVGPRWSTARTRHATGWS